MEQKLETFLTLCRTMHYGRAAEELDISQPAVSKHIQALEDEYGAKLFEYRNRRLYKTREGELLEEYAISMRYNEMSLLSKLKESPQKRLRIGATKSIGDYILYPEIYRYLERSDNELAFLVDNTLHLLKLLEAGELDFVVLEGTFDKSRYGSFLLRNEPFIGICSKDHRFRDKSINIEDLFSERLILREEGSGTRRILLDSLEENGWSVSSFKSVACISSFKLIKELVKENSGISFLYEAVVRNDEDIACFECRPITREHELNVVYLKDTDADKLAIEFLKK